MAPLTAGIIGFVLGIIAAMLILVWILRTIVIIGRQERERQPELRTPLTLVWSANPDDDSR